MRGETDEQAKYSKVANLPAEKGTDSVTTRAMALPVPADTLQRKELPLCQPNDAALEAPRLGDGEMDERVCANTVTTVEPEA